MAFDGLNVTISDEDAARIPDLLVRGALSLLPLSRGGVLSQLAELVRIRRSGGFCGLDVWLALWLYFASGSTTGIKRFWQIARPVVPAQRLERPPTRAQLALGGFARLGVPVRHDVDVAATHTEDRSG